LTCLGLASQTDIEGREKEGRGMSALSAREQGKLFFGKGKFSAAAEAYTEAINQDRENVGLYTNRALCNQKLGK